MKSTATVEMLILLFSFGFTSCRAQSPVIQLTQSNETTLQHWHKFSSPDGTFSMDFPAKPLEQRYSIDSPVGKLEVYSYKFTGSASYFISYTDYPSAIDGAAVADAALDRSRDGGVRQVNGRLVNESPVSIQGYPGRLLVVDSPNGGPQGSVITNKVYLVGRRLYSMQVAIPKNMHESLNRGAQKFLDSFKLINAANP